MKVLLLRGMIVCLLWSYMRCHLALRFCGESHWQGLLHEAAQADAANVRCKSHTVAAVCVDKALCCCVQEAIDKGWFRKERQLTQPGSGVPDYEAILAATLDIAEGMTFLHARDVVHGDLTGGASPHLPVILMMTFCMPSEHASWQPMSYVCRALLWAPSSSHHCWYFSRGCQVCWAARHICLLPCLLRFE